MHKISWEALNARFVPHPGCRQTDKQTTLVILHGQRKDPEVIKVSWPWLGLI